MMTPEIAVADTNLFIRLLTQDNPDQTEAALKVFQKAQRGELSLIIHDLTIPEIIWVLESVYARDRYEIRELILSLLNTPGIRVEPADLCSDVAAINMYANKNMDYLDAYTACWMKAKGISIIYTFDKKHFSRIEGIEVRVP